MVYIILIVLAVLIVLLFIAGNFFFDFSLVRHFSKGADPVENGNFDFTLLDTLAGTEEQKIYFRDNAQRLTCISDDGLQLVGYFLEKEGNEKFAILCHGYTGTHAEMLRAAMHYYEMGYSVLLPDARAHGESGGNIRGMGWLERKDIQNWIQVLINKNRDSSVILYGMSMGAATVMMTAGEALVPQVKAVIEDCGYTSVWAEFKAQMKAMFHLPAFPLLYISSFICQIRGHYNFKEASALDQVRKCHLPMLFIHGAKDQFVPFAFQDELYKAASGPKEKYICQEAAHCESLPRDPEGYWKAVDSFLKEYVK